MGPHRIETFLYWCAMISSGWVLSLAAGALFAAGRP